MLPCRDESKASPYLKRNREMTNDRIILPMGRKGRAGSKRMVWKAYKAKVGRGNSLLGSLGFRFGRCGSGNGSGGGARCIILGGVSACILWEVEGKEGEGREGSLYPES